MVRKDKRKLDSDLRLMEGEGFAGVLNEYQNRWPCKEFDKTSAEVSEFLRNLTRPKIRLVIEGGIDQDLLHRMDRHIYIERLDGTGKKNELILLEFFLVFLTENSGRETII